MKKLLSALLFIGAMSLTSCASDSFTASKAEEKLNNKGYTVTVYTGDNVKNNIQGFDYEGQNVLEAVFANKGDGDDKDVFLAFYFKNNNEASAFLKNDGNSNLTMMNKMSESLVGANLQAKIGTYNNVAYVASETSYAIVF